MSFKLHTTDEAFHDLDFLIRGCDKTDKRLLDALWKARDEYKRLFDHCEHQRDALRGWEKAWIEDQFLRKHAFIFADDESECHMKSIDNLREWANGLHGVYINQVDHTITITTGWDAPPDMDSVSLRDHVNGILDGIEREVAELTDERDLLKRQWEAGVDFDQRLEACADNREDVTLFGVDYTPLPVDADGVPIHVGDVMVYTDGDTCPLPVVALVPPAVFITEEGPRYADMCHHAPTVEDVLREFADEVQRCCDTADTIAEYAARLRLAGDE